jgi:hypothetical protein
LNAMPILIGGAAHAKTIYPWGGSIWDERQLLRYMTVMRCGDTAAGCERLQTEIKDRMRIAVHLRWQECLDAHEIKVPGPNSSLSASKHLSTPCEKFDVVRLKSRYQIRHIISQRNSK